MDVMKGPHNLTSGRDVGADTITALKVKTGTSEPCKPIKTDIDKAREFLEHLDLSETEFTFQIFDDKKPARPLARVLHGSLDEHFERLCELSSRGAGVYVTINRTDLKGRKKSNVVETRAVFVDLDGVPIDNWKRLSLRPHIGVMSSPGRAHLYYRVKGIGLHEWPEIQKRLAALMEGDPAVCDLPRVMRLPGFPHQKSDSLMVEAEYASGPLDAYYTREEFLKALDEAEEKRAAEGEARGKRSHARQSNAPSTKAPNRLADLCAEPISDFLKKFIELTRERAASTRIVDTFPPANAHMIADRCAQLRAMRDTSRQLPEPLWFACLGLLAFCKGGDEIAHEWSKGDPRYRFAETQSKLDRKREMSGPTTCIAIQDIDPKGCDVCPYAGKITTPVELGRPYVNGEDVGAKPEQAFHEVLLGTNDKVEEEVDEDPVDLFGNLTREPELTREMLPEVIADFAIDTAERLGVECAMVAVPALAACAAALHDGIKIQPKMHDTGWQESARLWVALVADPGGKKSPAIDKAMKPLVEIEAAWINEDAAKMAKYLAALEIYKAGRKRDKANVENIATPPVKPPQRRITISDATMEKLAFILADNERGVLAIHDELVALIAGFDAYRANGAGKDRAAGLQLWNGGPRLVDRVKIDGSVRVPNWSACVVGGIQPDKLREIAPRLSDDGFLQRFQPFAGRTIGPGEDRMPSHAAVEAYHATVRRLLDISPAMPPRPVRLSPEAHQHRRVVEQVAEDTIGLPSTAPALKGHLAKWGNVFARLLLVLHAVECASSGEATSLAPEVSGETAKKARDVMLRFFLPNALNFYREFFQASPVVEDARGIADYVLVAGLDSITMRDIRRGYRKLEKDEGSILRAMEFLTASGWAGDAERPKAGMTKWKINPRVHVAYAERAAVERKRREEERRKIVERSERLSKAL
jgi:hypothetical protein